MKKLFAIIFVFFLCCGFIWMLLSSAFAAPSYTGAGSPYEKCSTDGDDGPQKDSLICLVQAILDMARKGVGAIVVVMIVISGLTYMTSAGNPAQAEKGKKTLVGSIIGLIIVVMSYTVVKLLTILLG